MERCHGVPQSIYDNHPAGDVIGALSLRLLSGFLSLRLCLSLTCDVCRAENVIPGCRDDNSHCGTDDQFEWAMRHNKKMKGRKVWMGVKALHDIWKTQTFKKKSGRGKGWNGLALNRKGKLVLRDEVAALWG